MDDTYLEMIFYKNFNGDKKQVNNILKKYLDIKKVTCPEFLKMKMIRFVINVKTRKIE